MIKIYDACNHLLICTDSSENKLHSHSAVHIIISLEDDIEVLTDNQKINCKGILIPSRMLHTANTNGHKILVFMFDSTNIVSQCIQSLEILSVKTVEEIIKAYYCFEDSNKSSYSYKEFINQVLRCINVTNSLNREMDYRVIDAIKYIQENLDESICCKDVADHVFLSEGRFSHLFKKHVGMTFSAYLIYQRIIKTYIGVINGQSITEASIEAGFSSSAHFASVNKKNFGISASFMKKELHFHKIA